MTQISQRTKANAIRALSVDAVQKANSGHPGTPMGMADIAEVLWCEFLRHNPKNPNWYDRDRFILSNGHGSMLLYSLLHLTGYGLSIEEIKQFRQLHSQTPGHPEYGLAAGIETTTGPLGQGISNAVGMAIAEKTLAAQFNKPKFSIVDHYTYVFLGDGCMMEGLSHEVCSLAGTLKLGKLIAFYDDNGISIDGEVKGWFTDDTVARFQSYGWHVIPDIDGHDPEAVRAAITKARNRNDAPSLICCKTVIGFGSPNKAGKESSHGAPLGEKEVSLTKERLGWHYPPFDISDEIYQAWNAGEKGLRMEQDWIDRFQSYRSHFPSEAAEFERRMTSRLPEEWFASSQQIILQIDHNQDSISSRKASQNALEAFGPFLPELFGGSADLASSNLTIWSGSKGIQEDISGNYIYYGVREFGMAAIMNGIVLHRGFRPYGATFLIFSEYARNALRMAALMRIPNIFVFTHDSIGLGEDGPTHQPVEQLATLRLIPGMSVWRPCDAVESAVAWQQAIESTNQPFSLVFSRQDLSHQKRSSAQLEMIKKGGYVLKESAGKPSLILIATGSELELAMAAAEQLDDDSIRVVSMPSTDRFEEQDEVYRDSVLPPSVKARIAVEAGVTNWWMKYVGFDGEVIGIDRFGESAPSRDIFEYLGMTVNHIVDAIHRVGGN